MFQEDIYPHCASAKPAQSAEEWAAGGNKDPIVMNMDPDERKDEDGGDVHFTKKKTYDEVVAENMELKQLVKKLQDEIAELKGTSPSDEVKEDAQAEQAGDENGMDEDGADGDKADEDGGDEVMDNEQLRNYRMELQAGQ